MRGRFFVLGDGSCERVWLQYEVCAQIETAADLAPLDGLLAAAVVREPAWGAALARELLQEGLLQRAAAGLRVAGCPALEAALGRMIADE